MRAEGAVVGLALHVADGVERLDGDGDGADVVALVEELERLHDALVVGSEERCEIIRRLPEDAATVRVDGDKGDLELSGRRLVGCGVERSREGCPRLVALGHADRVLPVET